MLDIVKKYGMVLSCTVLLAACETPPRQDQTYDEGYSSGAGDSSACRI
jgi:hypothetical protein